MSAPYYTSTDGFTTRYYDEHLVELRPLRMSSRLPDSLLQSRTIVPLVVPDGSYSYDCVTGVVHIHALGVSLSYDGHLVVDEETKSPAPANVHVDGCFINGTHCVLTGDGWLIGEYLVIPTNSTLSQIFEKICCNAENY